MKMFTTASVRHKATALLVFVASFIGIAKVTGQTAFDVTNIAPIASTGAYVAIYAPTFFEVQGIAATPFTPYIFGTNMLFDSPGPSFGLSDPGLQFSGNISGSSIAPGTVLPISYNFDLSKTNLPTANVSWELFFSGNESSPVSIASGVLSAASGNFSGISNNYSFTTGTSSTFIASLKLNYNTGIAAGQPSVNVTMLNTGFGGQGITLGASAIPEPSTYAAIAGSAMLGFASWRRRRRATSAAIVAVDATA